MPLCNLWFHKKEAKWESYSCFSEIRCAIIPLLNAIGGAIPDFLPSKIEFYRRFEE